MVTSLLVSIVGLSALTTGAAPPSEAAGQDPRAIEARKACLAGEVDRGIRLLADYLSSTEDITAIYNMGRCYQQNGVVDKALLQFREYLRKARGIDGTERAEVEAHIKELEAEQERRSRAPSTPVVSAEVPSAPASDDDRHRTLRHVGIGLGAAGVLGLGVGTVFLFKVRQVNSDLAKERAASSPRGGVYTQLIKDGERAQTWQWILLGTGGAALAAGATCYLLGHQRQGEGAVAWTPWVAAGAAGAVVGGRF